nr:N-succinylarginine dihydrolase [Gammaproteobacteria bacterium]
MNILPAQEYNFDGLVGPTHNYAGLSHGNIASVNNSSLASNPKSAALQGLLKMKQLMDLGVPQAVLPPQPRPNLELLKNLGFSGTTEKILKQAYNTEPRL